MPLELGAVKSPDEFTDPIFVEYVYGPTPFEALICVVLLTAIVECAGVAASAAFTVTVALLTLPTESVAVTMALPLLDGAVNVPVEEFIEPLVVENV